MTTAAGADYLSVIGTLALALGIDIPQERRAAIALVLIDRRLTIGQIKLAARTLASDPTLDDKIRYGGTLTPADFVRIVDDPASPAAKGRTYTYHEALRLWQIRGEVGSFPESLFRRVDADGLILFALK